MTRRSPITILVLILVTFGIWALVWQVQTKREMNRAYATNIPTAWVLLIPIAGALYWSWKWSEGAEQATGMAGVSVFLLMVVPIVGIPVMVSRFNAALPPRVPAQATLLRAA